MVATLTARSGARPRRHAPEVYRRRRIVAAGLLAAVVVAGWMAVQGLLAGPSPSLPPSRDIAARQVVVQPGDSLWSIALASGDRGDIRPLVAELSAEVHGQALQPGEVISLPPLS